MELITYPLYQPRFRYEDRQGVYPTIIDFDREFASLDTKPIVANDLDLTSDDGKRLFNELVYSRYEGDVFSNVPKCPCGFLKSGEDEGERCPECGHLCESPTHQTIQPVVWIKAPTDAKVFMNIQIYTILKPKLVEQGFSTLDYLLDPKYRPPRLNSVQEEMANSVLSAVGAVRGVSSFYTHFDEIMEGLFTSTRSVHRADRRETVRLVKTPVIRVMREFIQKMRDVIFCNVLPFPSKIGFIIEKVGSITYIDPEMRPAMNALLSIAKSDYECRGQKDADSRSARAVRDLSAYYEKVDRNKLYSKPSVSRKLIFGMTPHFTFRTVITSKHLPHDHEVIDIPWGAAVLTFKLHIANKLLKEGYTPNEWLTMVYDNVQRKHHKLDMIFDELIRESPDGRGPSSIFTRFPSLKHNSTTRFFINVKRDPRHMSTSISLITVKAENADLKKSHWLVMVRMVILLIAGSP